MMLSASSSSFVMVMVRPAISAAADLLPARAKKGEEVWRWHQVVSVMVPLYVESASPRFVGIFSDI
jgi:hypothetical protein